jgi:two-component system response regulator DesR
MVLRERGNGPAPTVALALPSILLAEALSRVLHDTELHVVGYYATLPALLEKIRRYRPDLVLAGAQLGHPEVSPPEMLAQVCAAAPVSKLVVLARDVDSALARAIAERCARAVILESSPAADAVGILRQVLNGRTSFPSVMLERLSERPGANELSRRQLEVLEQLALGRSNEEIARELFISTNTVKFHLRLIYERLGVHNRVEAARLLEKLRAA